MKIEILLNLKLDEEKMDKIMSNWDNENDRYWYDGSDFFNNADSKMNQ